MVKFLLGIAVVAFTSLCGYFLAQKYRRKQLFFRQLYVFNERFLSEISYYRRPLLDFATKYRYKEEFGELLRIFFYGLEKKNYSLKSALDKPEYAFLDVEEKTLLDDYFSMLGKGDCTSQKCYFSSMCDLLKKKQQETEETCKKYANLYVKIGFLLGLLILILIL